MVALSTPATLSSQLLVLSSPSKENEGNNTETEKHHVSTPRMQISKLQALASFAALIDGTNAGLWVSEVPTSPQPYAVRHYGINGYAVGAQVYRFPVTGPSSDNAFTLISTATPASGYLGVLPHVHQTHYENFFCLKGRFQLWTADADTYANEEARLLTPGDYGAVPHNTTHTFQIQDP